ncbi:MAG TPA: HAMP domain-containing sensor histidine kinase [Arachnia sp.]|nr:HAMP domain-containing sensor histidine kinase [Arachnia sp.]
MIGSWWIRLRRGLGRLVSGQSLQWRLALLTGISVALSVLVVGTTSYVVTRWSLLEQLDRELVAVAQTASGTIASNVSNMGGLSGDLMGSSDGLLALVAADGLVKQVPGQPVSLPAGSEEIAVARMQSGSSARTLDADGTSYRVVSVPMSVDGAFYAVIYGRPTVALESTLASLWASLLAAGALGVMTTTLAALWAAQTVLAPVRRLSQAVKSVTQTDQLNPIRIYGRDDLGELTKSFNLMLRSLQTSREQQSQLIADAGHELRTPLTSMRTNIELLLADDTSGMLPEGARSVILGDVAAQLGEFSALVGDLVALTRDDHLQRPHEILDMAEVTESAIERARRRGPNITFDVTLEPTPVMGDPSTLERAITNLLDNAVKFSPSYGTIVVTLEDGTLTVVDEGPGIADEDLPLIFDRFYRSDRARNTPGTGLGLSIVDHTARAHGGSVRAGNDPDRGAKFVLRLPVIAESAEQPVL